MTTAFLMGQGQRQQHRHHLGATEPLCHSAASEQPSPHSSMNSSSFPSAPPILSFLKFLTLWSSNKIREWSIRVFYENGWTYSFLKHIHDPTGTYHNSHYKHTCEKHKAVLGVLECHNVDGLYVRSSSKRRLWGGAFQTHSYKQATHCPCLINQSAFCYTLCAQNLISEQVYILKQHPTLAPRKVSAFVRHVCDYHGPQN